jgi:hypothetical protein
MLDRVAFGSALAGIALAIVAWSRPTRDGWWVVALVVLLAGLAVAAASMVRGVRYWGLLAFSVLLSLAGVAGLLLGLTTTTDRGIPGRPLRRRHRVLLPELSGTPARADWARTARGEHASVPAFAKVSLDLAAVGAPLDLHERVHRAALDEVDHTRRALALAGNGVTTGALPGRGRLARLARMAVETFRDGCLGEGDAAAEAAAATGTTDDERAALAVIARDEAGHAELAWAILGWCVEEGGAPVAAVLRRELRRHPGRPGAVARATALLPPSLTPGAGRAIMGNAVTHRTTRGARWPTPPRR